MARNRKRNISVTQVWIWIVIFILTSVFLKYIEASIIEHLKRLLLVQIHFLCITLVSLIYKIRSRIIGLAQLNNNSSAILDMDKKWRSPELKGTVPKRVLKLLNGIYQPNCISPSIYLNCYRPMQMKKIYEFMDQLISCIIHFETLFRKIIVSLLSISSKNSK